MNFEVKYENYFVIVYPAYGSGSPDECPLTLKATEPQGPLQETLNSFESPEAMWEIPEKISYQFRNLAIC